MSCWLHSKLLELHYMAVFSKIFLWGNLCTESFPEKGRTVRKAIYEKSHVHHTNQICVVDHFETFFISFSRALIHCNWVITTASFVFGFIAINVHMNIPRKTLWYSLSKKSIFCYLLLQLLDKNVPFTLRITVWYQPCCYRCICTSVRFTVQMLISYSKVLDQFF